MKLYLLIISALELKVNKQKKNISHSVPKTFDFFQNSSVPFHQVTFYHSISYVLLIDKQNERRKSSIKFERNALSTQKKAFKKKRKKTYTSNQTSSERLKVTIQSFRMGNKELKMKLGQLHEEISKASLPVSADLSNDFKSIILETGRRKLSPFMRLFWEDSKNVYNLKIMLHITP